MNQDSRRERSAEDGKTWTQLVDHAEWRKRSGHSLVAFQEHLWLLAGEDSPIGAMAG